jgi:hypothetical protein
VVLRAGQRELLDLAALRQGEHGRAAAAVARVQRVEPVSVEVVQHVAGPVLGRESHLGDLGHRHLLGGEQDHLCSSPGDHRTAGATHDPQQPVALVVADRSKLDPAGHRLPPGRPLVDKENETQQSSLPAISLEQGEACLQRH